MSLPGHLPHLGLWSNRSTCDGPPPCQRTTTRFAFGAKCGRPGSPGSPFGRSAAAPRAASCPSSDASAAMPTPLAAEPKNWRRVTRATFSRWRSFIAMIPSRAMSDQVAHSRVRASSRFRIARQTAESAACSTTSSVSSRFDSPTARKPCAPRRPRVDRRLLLVGATQHLEVELRRPAAQHAPEGVRQPVVHALRRFHAPLGQRPRGLDPGRVVERGEGVQRRAGRRRTARGRSAGSRRRTCWPGRRSAARTCRGCADRGRRPRRPGR